LKTFPIFHGHSGMSLVVHHLNWPNRWRWKGWLVRDKANKCM